MDLKTFLILGVIAALAAFLLPKLYANLRPIGLGPTGYDFTVIEVAQA